VAQSAVILQGGRAKTGICNHNDVSGTDLVEAVHELSIREVVVFIAFLGIHRNPVSAPAAGVVMSVAAEEEEEVIAGGQFAAATGAVLPEGG